MKMTFRWYGESDSITLDHIRQIPCITGVVTPVYSVPVGRVWEQEEIDKMKAIVNAKGLEMEVIESVPVHEDIKLRQGNYQLYIDNYKENIRRLAKAGVKCICYNLMPVFDWTRSRLDQPLPDGSFEESGHLSECGSLDVVEILKAYHDIGFKGYLRPDHGRMIWGETGKPGYGLYDRALGAMYMAGIWETLDKMKGI